MTYLFDVVLLDRQMPVIDGETLVMTRTLIRYVKEAIMQGEISQVNNMVSGNLDDIRYNHIVLSIESADIHR